MSHDFQSEVDQIISNVTKSSSGIFHLLQVPLEVEESITTTSTTTATRKAGSIRMKQTPTNLSGYHKVKKLQSKRERDAIRSAYRMRMIANGVHCGPPCLSSSSEEESLDTNIFAAYHKRFNKMTCTAGSATMSKPLYSPPVHPKNPFAASSDEMFDISEPFEGFPNSTKRLKLGVNGHAGSLSDNYLTSPSQNDINERLEKLESCGSSSEDMYLNSVIQINRDEQITIVEKKFIKHDESGGANERQTENLDKQALQIQNDDSLDLKKWQGYSDQLNKIIVKEEILNNYVINSKMDFDFENQEFHQCNGCKDWFQLETGLQEHMNRETKHFVLSCQYCQKDIEFSNRCKLLQHLTDHQISPTVDYLQQFTIKKPLAATKYLLSVNNNAISLDKLVTSICVGEIKQEVETKNSQSDVKKYKGYENQPKQVLEISKARTDDGVFKCLKCFEDETKFITTDEEIFYAHVKYNHTWSKYEMQQLFRKNGDRSEFWCPECSDTFVTKLALTMHLKVTHEFLQDITVYLKKVGYEGEIPLLENQCDVCYLLFDEPLDLYQHMRTHGLAFLRLQKRQRLQYTN